MSEVDRLSNSGLYPALPIAEKRSRKDGTPGQGPARAPKPAAPPAAPAPQQDMDPSAPRPPGSRIDEYA